MQEELKLGPVGRVAGEINLVGSKSISNRLLLLASLSHGKTTLNNLLASDDIKVMLEALDKLGVIIINNKGHYIVEGNGGNFKSSDIYLENSGTAMRSLTAVLSAVNGEFIVRGNKRMTERPIKDLVDSLSSVGGQIEYLENEGFPPLHIKGEQLSGGRIDIDGSISSQFLTGILIMAPLMKDDVTIYVKNRLVSQPYIDITVNLMKLFGVEVINNGYKSFYIKSGQKYQAPKNTILVEGDASSASYFMAAATIKGGTIRINGIGKDSIQGDIAFLDVIKQIGASVKIDKNWVEVTGDNNILKKGIDVNLNHIPDAAMTLATMALFLEGKTIIRDIYNWRVKETDRLSAMANELRKTGAKIEEGEDYIIIHPPKIIEKSVIDTYNDHRMAMCFSLLALSDVGVTIRDPKCTSKTFPEFFDIYQSIFR